MEIDNIGDYTINTDKEKFPDNTFPILKYAVDTSHTAGIGLEIGNQTLCIFINPVYSKEPQIFIKLILTKGELEWQ